MEKKLPKFLESVLWSYDLKDIDIKKDKNLIIQQVLNHGTKKHLKWLFNNYSKKQIKDVLKNPKRGFWYDNVLNYWLTIFNLKISEDKYKLAIREIFPSLEKIRIMKRILKKEIRL
ncbi:hypothetical protein KKA23_03195 [Patescibacteria group bacterium]|nr:hypothetical protein [Patescibacteria group bacterium]MBU3922860.1 hypothetical protein [Patescibacteria group bacterium]